MKDKVIACVLGLILSVNFKASAQAGNAAELTLKQAVEAAITNNLLVRQTDLQMQAAGVNLKQAKANMLPDVLGDLGHGLNQGRSIDPFTNAYINQNITYANYSLSSA